MNDLSLSEKWNQFKQENPKVRIRDAAVQLQTSEMALVATACGTQNTRLKNEFTGILNRLEALGSVMALTRSNHAVHESHGIYRDMKKHGEMVLFLRPGIDARFFLNKWAAIYAMCENDRHSLQFFDQQGDAIHKIYITKNSNFDEYQKLVTDFKSENQGIFIEQPTTEQSSNFDASTKNGIDTNELKDSWRTMKNVHDA